LGQKVVPGWCIFGQSFVSDPFGQVVADAPADASAVLVAECDRGQIEQVRRDWPFLRDRRIDAYAPITSVQEHGGYLYFGSLERESLARMPTPAAPAAAAADRANRGSWRAMLETR